MGIKNKIKNLLIEQAEEPKLTRGQIEQLTTLKRKWVNVYPEMTDEQAKIIYLKARDVVSKININNPQTAVGNFLRRNDGKFGHPLYTLEDLRSIIKIDLISLIEFLHEFDLHFENPIGGSNNGEDQTEKFNRIFKVNGYGITKEKIEASKSMWEGDTYKVIDEGDFRVYEIPSMQVAQKFGYYYQELLRQKIMYNIENGLTPKYGNPWCIEARGVEQKITHNGVTIISGGANMYTTYRERSRYYFVIDESKDLFNDPTQFKNHYIGVILVSKDSYQEAGMYNGQISASWEELIKIWPKIKDHRDKLIFRPFDEKFEMAGSETTLNDLINENENSEYEFARQKKSDKRSFIIQGRPLRKPKSWLSLTEDLRQEYINLFDKDNLSEKCGSFDFYHTILKSSSKWFVRLDNVLKSKGITNGINAIVDNLMSTEFIKAFTGRKNQNIRIYISKLSKKYGIFDSTTGEFLKKDGIDYSPTFVRGKREDIDDLDHDAFYWSFEFTGDNGTKFYTIHDDDAVGDDRFKCFILSEKKWNEIRDKFLEDTSQEDLPNTSDLGEIEKGV